MDSRLVAAETHENSIGIARSEWVESADRTLAFTWFHIVLYGFIWMVVWDIWMIFQHIRNLIIPTGFHSVQSRYNSNQFYVFIRSENWKTTKKTIRIDLFLLFRLEVGRTGPDCETTPRHSKPRHTLILQGVVSQEVEDKHQFAKNWRQQVWDSWT